MGYNVISRKAAFNMGGSSTKIPIGTKEIDTTQFRTMCLQLMLSGLDVATSGTFQLLTSNDGTEYRPVADRSGFTYKAVVAGNVITSYFIYIDETVCSAQYIALDYTRIAGGGTLDRVLISGTPA